MLFGKKKRIAEHLKEKQNSGGVTAFDTILSEYLWGSLKESFIKLGFKAISIHIDWLADYKCIGIQAKFRDYFFDIQIDPTSFSISYDKDEADDDVEFELKDASLFYKTVEGIIQKFS